MKRVLTIIASVALLWGLALTGAAAAGTEEVQASFDKTAVDPGDEVSLTITATQADESHRDGTFLVRHPAGALEFTGANAGSDCQTATSRVECSEVTSHIHKSDTYHFTVSDDVERGQTLDVWVDATSGGETAQTNVSLTILDLATPQDPTVTQATCEAEAAVVVPDVDGVAYSVDGNEVDPGTYGGAPAGEVEVTASPRSGYRFTDDAVSEWTLTVDEYPGDDECKSPSPDPTDTGSPDPSDPATPEPTPSETQVAEVENKGDSLPLTGSSTGLIALIAAGLLAAGGATLGGLRLARR